jgi:hypothetical protein
MPYLAPASSFQRPGDTTQYAGNDLVANSTTAGQVVPLRWSMEQIRGRGRLFGVRLYKSTAAVTAAKFNVHVFLQSPTPTNGDNGAYAVSTAKFWLATIACDLSTGAEVTGADLANYFALTNPVMFDLMAEGQSDVAVSANPALALFGLIEVQTAATFTPGNAELFKAVLSVEG